MIDSTFTKINRLFVSSFENENDRTFFSKYYVLSVQIKDFNVLIDRKSFFDTSIKNHEETYEQTIEIERNYDYTTGNLLDYEYFYETLQIKYNRFKQTNSIRKPWFKTANKFYLKTWKNMEEQQSQKKQLLNFHKIIHA